MPQLLSSTVCASECPTMSQPVRFLLLSAVQSPAVAAEALVFIILGGFIAFALIFAEVRTQRHVRMINFNVQQRTTCVSASLPSYFTTVCCSGLAVASLHVLSPPSSQLKVLHTLVPPLPHSHVSADSSDLRTPPLSHQVKLVKISSSLTMGLFGNVKVRRASATAHALQSTL